jgi:hypothetical protein
VRIYQPRLVLRAGLELAPTHSYKRSELSGTISADWKGRPDLWVRLVALYSSDLIQSAVDSSGRFELDGMGSGKYLILLLDKDKVIATKSIDIVPGKQTVNLTVGLH